MTKVIASIAIHAFLYIATLAFIAFGIDDGLLPSEIVRYDSVEILVLFPLVLYFLASIVIPLLPFIGWRKRLLARAPQRAALVVMVILSLSFSGFLAMTSISGSSGSLSTFTMAPREHVDALLEKGTAEEYKRLEQLSVENGCLLLRREVADQTLSSMGEELHGSVVTAALDAKIGDQISIEGLALPADYFLTPYDFQVDIGGAKIGMKYDLSRYFTSTTFSDMCAIVYYQLFDTAMAEGKKEEAYFLIEMADFVSKGTRDKKIPDELATRRAQFNLPKIEYRGGHNYDRPIDPVTGMFLPQAPSTTPPPIATISSPAPAPAPAPESAGTANPVQQ